MNSEWKELPVVQPPVDQGPVVNPADYLVDHSATLGFDSKAIDSLRPPFVIDGFVRQGGVMLLGAESKTRKSWLAQDAGIAVIGGFPWLSDEDGEDGFTTNQARAFIFDLELDSGEIAYRFAKTRAARFPDPETAARITEGLRHYCLEGLTAEEVIAQIEAVIPDISPGDLVVIDCLYRLCPDGNDPALVEGILNLIKRWARITKAALLVVDHFRKAGADKARDRFNGSYMKQAIPTSLVAIEALANGIYELQIDARSFHGEPKVWCRWDSAGYKFTRVSQAAITAAKDDAELVRMVGWLTEIWKCRAYTAPVTAKEAAAAWSLSDQGARDRFKKLLQAELVEETSNRPRAVKLAERGLNNLQPLTK